MNARLAYGASFLAATVFGGACGRTAYGSHPDSARPDVVTQDAPQDVAPPDTLTDVPSLQDVGPPSHPCDASALLNLNTLGALTGNTVSARLDLTSTPAATPMGFAPSCTTARVVHVLALSYTVRTTSRLLVSTLHPLAPGDAPYLYTVVVAQTSCTSTAVTEIGCSAGAADALRPASTASSHASIFTSRSSAADGTLLAGTTVYVFIGVPDDGPEYPHPLGPFELSVTEITPPSAVGGACEPAAVPSLCAAGLTCLPSGTDDSTFACAAAIPNGGACDPQHVANGCIAGSSCADGVCRIDGTQGGLCIAFGTCNAGLGCSAHDQCEPIVPVGSPCDVARVTSLCAAGNSCQMGSAGGTCITDGTRGGVCLLEPDLHCTGAGLVCNEIGVCVAADAVGAACDMAGLADSCTPGNTCIAVGATTICAVNGTAAGTWCRSDNTCDAGLRCATDIAHCVPAR